MKVFDRDSCEFVLWLSREEWQLVHALSFAWEVHGLMPEFRSLTPSYLHVIATLQRDHGYEFAGISVDQDGDLWAKTEAPVCRELMLTLQLMQQGGAPDLLVHVPAAIEFAEQRIPGLDLEPLRQVNDDLQARAQEIRRRRRDAPPWLKEQIRNGVAVRAAAMRQIKDLV